MLRWGFSRNESLYLKVRDAHGGGMYGIWHDCPEGIPLGEKSPRGRGRT